MRRRGGVSGEEAGASGGGTWRGCRGDNLRGGQGRRGLRRDREGDREGDGGCDRARRQLQQGAKVEAAKCNGGRIRVVDGGKSETGEEWRQRLGAPQEVMVEEEIGGEGGDGPWRRKGQNRREGENRKRRLGDSPEMGWRWRGRGGGGSVEVEERWWCSVLAAAAAAAA